MEDQKGNRDSMIAIVGVRGIDPSKTPEGFFYIGEAYAKWQESPLSNAFPIIHDNQRPRNRQMYKAWLWEVMQDESSDQRKMLDAIAEQAREGTAILGCWDSNRPLHADIVKAAVEWLLKQEAEHA